MSFSGSDTLEAAVYVRNLAGHPVLSSIPATEHSIMTSWPTEVQAVNQMVNNYGSGLFATVADSYNYSNYLENILPQFVNRIRELGGTIIVRPDSGNPVECVLQALDACWRHFGGHVNNRGFRVLHNCAVIQGDGIDYNIIKQILEATYTAGYSVQNVAFGMGAGLLHNHKRDTLSFATKLCEVDGNPVFKHPSTDMKKWSLPGRLIVTGETNTLAVHRHTNRLSYRNRLNTIYEHGWISPWDKWDAVVERLDTQWRNSPSKHNVISNDLIELQKSLL